MKQELKGRDLLLVGFTLFSMFFGAGNLIFPPSVGAQAGVFTWPAMVGMAISAVGLPVLGVVAVARAGGLSALGNRVHPVFSRIFTIVSYLAIGPCLAIPRTASTSFEMAVPPFVGSDAPIWAFQLAYSTAFFLLALLIALRPEKLTDRLGKIMCPILVLLIVVTFIGCLVNPPGGYGQPQSEAYAAAPVVKGFLDGYQTMDTIAALAFGIIIALNIRVRGVEEQRAVVRGTVKAGCIAGAMLLVVYTMLAHVGALSGGAFPGAADNGAAVLTNLVAALFGTMGNVLLAAIFMVACFNVCVGLICSCGEFFHSQFPQISYRAWAVSFAAVSLLIANAGLSAILKVSVPVLSAIYPVAIMLIVLSLFQKRLEGRHCIYPVTILFTGVASVLYALADAKLMPGGVAEVLQALPLAQQGLGWVIPAGIGVLLGVICSMKKKKE